MVAAERSETLAHDLRAQLRLAFGRSEDPTAAIIDSRTLGSTSESGSRAGYDGAKRKRGSKVHLALDTSGHLLALHVTPADVGDCQAVARLVADVQEAAGETVKLAYVDQGYTGEKDAEATVAEGITLEVVKFPKADMGLFCCRAAGLFISLSLGQHIAVGSSKITNATPRPWRDSMSSPSTGTCSNKPQRWCKVHDSLKVEPTASRFGNPY